MIDDGRARKWEAEARNSLMCYLDTGHPAGHLAAIVLALLADRAEREDFIARIRHPQQPTGDATAE